LQNEVLVYDQETNKAHCLNSTAAEVFHLCDGKRNVNEIIRALEQKSIAPSLVKAALAKLSKSGLLINPIPSVERLDVTRRALVKKMSTAAAIALPVVASILVPKAEAQASCLANFQLCLNGEQCCSGNCGALGINLVCLP
jgi:hypothetical protein